MLIEYKDYVNSLAQFFKDKKWGVAWCGEHAVFTKHYNEAITRKIRPEYLLDDKLFYLKVLKSFAELNIPNRLAHSIENEHSDTDFIVAGLQLAANDLKKSEIVHTSFYSLQPVVRLSESELYGQQNEQLTSFVNLCSVDINTSLNEYLYRIDQWISVFSGLSLHASGFKLISYRIKNDRVYNGIPFYDGLKLKFVYKNREIAVANLFTADCNQGPILVSDFGSSYERVLGCINGEGNFFKPLYPSFQVLYGDYRINDRLRTAVLMCLCGIVPNSKGAGQKLRNLIKDATTVPEIERIKEAIIHYYSYYSKFINSKKSLPDVLRIIETEIEQQKKVIVAGKHGNNILDKSLDEVCRGVILEQEISKRKSILSKTK